MTMESIHEESPEQGQRNAHDLTQIRGLEAAQQEWLQELLGIQTVQALAETTADQIESWFRAEGHIVSRSQIEDWIAQAQEICSNPAPQLGENLANPQPSLTTPNAGKEATSGGEVSSGVETGSGAEHLPAAKAEADSPRSPIANQDWQTIAQFDIQVQQRQQLGESDQQIVVRDSQTNQVTVWSGAEWEGFEGWWRSQFTLFSREQPPNTNPLSLELTQITAIQPPLTHYLLDQKSAAVLGVSSLKSNYPFSLELSFQIRGSTAAQTAAEQVTYQVQVSLRDRASRAITPLTMTRSESFKEGQFFYTTTFPGITLPPGLYRLQVLITLPEKLATPGCVEIPLLQLLSPQ
jgi:hypothetical protein